MNKKVFVCLAMIFLVPALACGLASGENKSAVGQVSLQAGPTLVPTPTNLSIVEDIEKVREVMPEPALVVSSSITDPLTTDPSVSDIIIAAAEEGPSLAIGASDDDDQENGEEAKDRTNDVVALNTATATPTPTPTNTPTPTPSSTPVAVSGDWPHILPDATGLESGDGYVRYLTGTDAGAVADFYRREMAGYGWAEMSEPDLAAELGLTDFSTLVPMPDGGTLLIFSNDGGETLSFVMISEVGGQVGVAQIWPAE